MKSFLEAHRRICCCKDQGSQAARIEKQQQKVTGTGNDLCDQVGERVLRKFQKVNVGRPHIPWAPRRRIELVAGDVEPPEGRMPPQFLRQPSGETVPKEPKLLEVRGTGYSRDSSFDL
ncbi:hypothetical protein PIB30_047837 [Stylosanthes scabra]|uniref:Uncharacterized protein n=1 Tax=Stylosanthes scabra TaxID=79078 RepID=A0ABU6RHM1_9FABA|nr:hypothetical protein [Stylosanthes scabra]